MEARGEFTIEGCIEMAWIMGFIKHFDGRLKDGSLDDKEVMRKISYFMLASVLSVRNTNPFMPLIKLTIRFRT